MTMCEDRGKAVMIVVAADSTGSLVNVNAAVMVVDERMLSGVAALAMLCRLHGLTEVHKSDAPLAWLPAGIEERWRLTNPELVVTPASVWYSDTPKNEDESIETRGMHLDALRQLLNAYAGMTIHYQAGKALILAHGLLTVDAVADALSLESD